MRERILAIYVDHYRRLHALAREEDAELSEVPDDFLRGLVGGIAELVQKCLLDRSEEEVAERLSALTPTLVEFATTILTRGRQGGGGRSGVQLSSLDGGRRRAA